MARVEDKGKMMTHNQDDMMGVKPYGNVGPGRTAQETAIVGKLKKKKAGSLRASGSTVKSGEKANAGECSKAIGAFVNRK